MPALPKDDLEDIVRDCGAAWSDFRNARVFFTGATGFFGRWMLESLLTADRVHALGVEATVLSRDPTPFFRTAEHLAVDKRLRWRRGSVTGLSRREFAAEKFDFFVHLATEADSSRTVADPVAAVDVIAGGTGRALAVARATGVRRFLFTSSGSVYGPQPPEVERLDEEFPARPEASPSRAYAISGRAKLDAEQQCAAASVEGLATVTARCFTFAGPGLPLDAKFAFGNFLDDALHGRPIRILGDGAPVRSYLYAAELATWLWLLLLRGQPGAVYNVGSERPVSLRSLAGVIASELGSSAGVTVAQPSTDAAPHRYVPSTRRARELLGVEEKLGLAEIVRRTAAWQRIALQR